MTRLLRTLWADDAGQDLVEYALIILLIALALVAALSALHVPISTVFGNAASALSAA